MAWPHFSVVHLKPHTTRKFLFCFDFFSMDKNNGQVCIIFLMQDPLELVTLTKAMVLQAHLKTGNTACCWFEIVVLNFVYLLVLHVPFITKNAWFLLQCTKCSREASLVKELKARSNFVQQRACLEHFVHCKRILHWALWQHDEPTDVFFRLKMLCIPLSGCNLWNLNAA